MKKIVINIKFSCFVLETVINKQFWQAMVIRILLVNFDNISLVIKGISTRLERRMRRIKDDIVADKFLPHLYLLLSQWRNC